MYSSSIGHSQHRDIRKGEHESAKCRCNFRIQVYLAMSQLDSLMKYFLPSSTRCVIRPPRTAVVLLSFYRHSHYCHFLFILPFRGNVRTVRHREPEALQNAGTAHRPSLLPSFAHPLVAPLWSPPSVKTIHPRPIVYPGHPHKLPNPPV